MEIWYVTDEQWEQLWELLEAPERELPKLRELFARPTPWEDE